MDLYKTQDIKPDGYIRKVFSYKGKKYVLTTYKDTTSDDNSIKSVVRASIFHTNGRKVSPELRDQILADMKETVDNVRKQTIKVTQGDE